MKKQRAGVFTRAGRWADERLGVAHFARTALDKIFPDHWSFMVGEIALYCLVILILTGIYLTFFFSPSAHEVVYHGSYKPLNGVKMSEAYHSTIRLSFDIRAGLVFRQIHHWAALLFVASIVVHLCRVFFTGAFRRPRELNWIIGVTLLVLAIGNGFTGYSLPDDLLSGTGLRIAYSIVLAIPFIGTWFAFLFFGGEFPAAALEPRLFVLHVLLVPALIIVLLTAHMAILWRQKHTQFTGPGRTERNVVGSFLYPTYAARSIGLFAAIAAVLSALGGLAQINPVWLYGPFEPAAVTTAAQPDWYVGWLEGALRLFPPWRFEVFGYTISEVFVPGLLLPGITFGLLYLWPFIEARITGDRLEHNLLDSPRDRPMRTAIGVGVLTFYVVLVVAGAQDIVAQKLHVGIPSVTNTLRVLIFVLPLLAAWFTWHTCRDLAVRGARQEDYPRPYPKARTPYQEVPGTAAEPQAPAVEQPRRSAAVRAGAAVVAGAAAAAGFLLGRRRPKRIVFEKSKRD